MLNLINIEGMVITAYANRCQNKTIGKIIDNKSNYVIKLKGTHGIFYTYVKEIFNDELSSDFKIDKDNYNYYTECTKN